MLEGPPTGESIVFLGDLNIHEVNESVALTGWTTCLIWNASGFQLLDFCASHSLCSGNWDEERSRAVH